jgi:uncharacterized protein YkwD
LHDESTGSLTLKIRSNFITKKILFFRAGLLLLGQTLLLGLFAVTLTATPAPVAAADNNCQTFPETGFAVCGRFLSYWRANGGLEQQGLPISPVFEEKNALPPSGDGAVHKVQYFERARFEYHPENQAPYDVLRGLLGMDEFGAKYKDQKLPDLNPAENCQMFFQTGQKLCGRFLEFWQSHGGLAQQGLPISGMFEEANQPTPLGDGQTHQVQYFERGRFEYHPENQPPYDVMLGLVGKNQLKAHYGSGVLPPEVAYPPDVSTPPVAAAAKGDGPDAEELAFLTLLNNYRQANGRSVLVFDANLYQSASWMAKDMATHNYISHTDSTGRSATTRIKAFGYPGRWVGENIAGGFEKALDNLNVWQSDQIHIDNMLQASYTHAAAARYYYANSLNKWHWVLDMGS